MKTNAGMTVRGAARFFLNEIPTRELPNEIAEVAKRLKNGVISEESALAYLEQVKHGFLTQWIRNNSSLNSMIAD